MLDGVEAKWNCRTHSLEWPRARGSLLVVKKITFVTVTMFKTWSDRNPTPFFGLVGLSSLWMVFVTFPNLLVRTIPVFINQMVTSAVFSAFVQWLKPHTICDYKSSTNRGFAHCSIEWRHSRTCIDYMHVHLIRMMMAVPLQLCTCCIDGSIHIMYYMMSNIITYIW